MSNLYVNLTAINVNDIIELSWNSNITNSVDFRVFRRKYGDTLGNIYDEEFQSISVFDPLEQVKDVRILNIYPDTNDEIMYERFDYDIVTIKKHAILKKWIEEKDRSYKDNYIDGIFEVDCVTIEDLNKDKSILKTSAGFWKYDIICIGFWDHTLKTPELDNQVLTLLREFANSGRGLLFSKDTIGGNYGGDYLGKLRELFNIKVGVHDHAVNFDDDHGYRVIIQGNKIKNVKNGSILKMPCNVCKYLDSLNITNTSTSSNFAYGDIWFNIIQDNISSNPSYANLPDELRKTCKFYLCTYNNTAMIQIDNRNISDVEKKILLNTLAYLKQTTSNKNSKDYGAVDNASPLDVHILNTYKTDTELIIDYDIEDVGTKYEYYVEGKDLITNKTARSNKEIITVKNNDITFSYELYMCDSSYETIKARYVSSTTKEKTLEIKDIPRGYYIFRIKGEDQEGNVSPITEEKMYFKGKDLSVHYSVAPHTPNGSKYNNRYRGPQESHKTRFLYNQINKNLRNIDDRLNEIEQSVANMLGTPNINNNIYDYLNLSKSHINSILESEIK